MKIAIITTHYANNYGALLQTYAMQRFLNEELKQEAEVLAYFPARYNNSWKIMKKPSTIRDLMVQIYLLIHWKNIIGFMKRKKKNQDFTLHFIKRSKSYYSSEEIKRDHPQYDCFISGSDQIWNLKLFPGGEPAFFLDFASAWGNTKKIAYACSVADPIPEVDIPKVRNYLKVFDAISVREISDVGTIQSLTEKKVYHVADPVFLLTSMQWESVAHKPAIKEKYILCYFLSYGDLSSSVVKKLRELTGYKVVNININAYDKFKSDYCIWDASPLDFIGYIQNAAFVCTNSYHCTAFSIIFRKNFVVVPKKVANARIKSLQQVFGISDRFVNEEWLNTVSREWLNIDYSEYNEKLEKFRRESITYLIKSLGLDYDTTSCQ